MVVLLRLSWCSLWCDMHWFYIFYLGSTFGVLWCNTLYGFSIWSLRVADMPEFSRKIACLVIERIIRLACIEQTLIDPFRERFHLIAISILVHENNPFAWPLIMEIRSLKLLTLHDPTLLNPSHSGLFELLGDILQDIFHDDDLGRAPSIGIWRITLEFVILTQLALPFWQT